MSNNIPEYTLLAVWPDDTMDVVCHYHHKPTRAELDDMIVTYLEMVLKRPDCVVLSKTKSSKIIPPVSEWEDAR